MTENKTGFKTNIKIFYECKNCNLDWEYDVMEITPETIMVCSNCGEIIRPQIKKDGRIIKVK
jgi:uncharacterized Zn finger protein